MNSAPDFVTDPDRHLTLGSSGPEHSLSSYFRAEKLEFSSIRHMRFSTKMMIMFLLGGDKKISERHASNVAAAEAAVAAAEAADAAMPETAEDDAEDGSLEGANERVDEDDGAEEQDAADGIGAARTAMRGAAGDDLSAGEDEDGLDEA